LNHIHDCSVSSIKGITHTTHEVPPGFNPIDERTP